MSYLDSYRFWRDNAFFDEQTRMELSKLDEIKDYDEIKDRFYKDLEFGTAGLRAIMGAGTNRLNKYTIAKATAGYGNYLKNKYNEECLKNRGIVVCYDTRNNSKFFAEIASKVFSSLGISVKLFENARPIPVLSFTITKLKAVGGIMITASHNTKEYNGYKVYDATGCQLGIDESNLVTEFIEKIEDFSTINFDGKTELISEIDTTNEFVEKILTTSKFENKKAKKNFKILYTPLYGTGLVPVVSALQKDGFNLEVLEEQKNPNGDFPTVVSPNPGDKYALEFAILMAKKIDADMVIGTDPDSDRVGVAVKSNGEYVHLSGNQIGILLSDFLFEKAKVKNVKKPVLIKSIVSSNLAGNIAKSYGATVFETLTGFKFIGELIQKFETAKLEQNYKEDFDIVLGFEESYGYLTNTFVRDKDAVGSAMIIAELGAALKSQGKTIVSKLNELYSKFGYFYDEQEDIVLCGIDKNKKINAIMTKLRNSDFLFENGCTIVDFLKSKKLGDSFGELPVSNVLKYDFVDGSFIAVRPSGTEPKIKFYYSILGKDLSDAKARKEKYKQMLDDFIKNV